MALSREDFLMKAAGGTLTVREAVEFSESLATVSENAKKNIRAIISGFEKQGLDPDMLYKDVKNPEVIDAKLSPSDGSIEPYRPNGYVNLQALENNVIRPIFAQHNIHLLEEADPTTGLSRPMYPQLTGQVTGRTQRTKPIGSKKDIEDVDSADDVRPMRDLIPKEKIDAIYNENISQVAADEKFGPQTARLLEYHKITANRPAQLFRMKKSLITLERDANGEIVTVKVKGKKTTATDKKARPDYEWDAKSPAGRLLIEAYNTSTTDFLFDTDTGDAEKIQRRAQSGFKKYIQPSLLRDHVDALPLKNTVKGEKVVREPFSTIGVIRSIVPKYLQEEFKVHHDLVRGVMGHVDTSELSKSYTDTGLIPVRDIPFLLDNPSDFGAERFRGGMGAGFGPIIQLTEDQVAEVRQKLFDITQTKNAAEEQIALNKFLTAVQEQPEFDPEKVRAAGFAKGQAEALFEQGRQAGMAEIEADADLDAAGPQQIIQHTPEGIEKLKAAGLWNDDMDRLTNPNYVDPKVSKMEAVGNMFDRSVQTGIKGAGAAAVVYDPFGTAIEETIDTLKDKTLGKVVGGGAARKIPGVNLLIPGGFAFPALSGDFEEADILAKVFGGTRDDFVDMSPEELAPYRAAYEQAAEAAKEKEKQQTMFKAFGAIPESADPEGFISTIDRGSNPNAR
tara:strand:+ start:158 stop:2185 length:2028 start_codon:yes stop_codon:yes gene_type:complete